MFTLSTLCGAPRFADRKCGFGNATATTSTFSEASVFWHGVSARRIRAVALCLPLRHDHVTTDTVCIFVDSFTLGVRVRGGGDGT